MKIVYSHLLGLLDKKPSKKELSEKLFQLGHEHEISGEIFDLEITPNRGDCLSLHGIARDLNYFYEHKPNKDIYIGEIPELKIDFENKSENLCPKISFLEIEIDKNPKKYKNYLENYFLDLKVNKNNFFTDVSNYLAYETGQPTHCYEKAKINGKLSLEVLEKNNVFKTLFNEEIELKSGELVFKIDQKVINFAGVMGGIETACNENTKKVLVECAAFEPQKILNKSRKYNLNSEASYKFERGVDPLVHDYVLRRFIKIVGDHANILSVAIKEFSTNGFKKEVIDSNQRITSEILGYEVDENKFKTILEKLGFIFNDNIEVPSYRNDIHTANDLSEEVARVIGYDNINKSDFNIENLKVKKDINKVMYIENFLYENGFSEVVNFPFTSEKDTSSIELDNPLDSNKRYLRKSLTNSLLDNLLFNERRQKDSIKLFEISDIFSKDNEKIICSKRIGIIISGRLDNNYKDFSKKLDKKYLKSLLENLFEDPKINSNIIEIDKTKLNSKNKNKIFAFECDLDEIKMNSSLPNPHEKRLDQAFNTYKKISEYPLIKRDLSFHVTNSLKLERLHQAITEVSIGFLEEVFMFDFFILEASKSVKVGYRFLFRSVTKTLEDKEVDQAINDIIKIVQDIGDIEIPGLLE